MTKARLISALTSTNWSKNVDEFCLHDSAVINLDKSALRLAVWSKQFENIEKGNPALSFIREMQSSAHITIAACALAHYKLAASGMRTVVFLGMLSAASGFMRDMAARRNSFDSRFFFAMSYATGMSGWSWFSSSSTG